MDVLRKTLKKLSDAEYQALLQQVAGKKKNKPYMVLEAARNEDHVDDTEMMETLQVNPSAYYTLKSRLNSKIASVLSQKVESPVKSLMAEVIKVPACLYADNREFSIRALEELEKQLKEFDMSNELITVYKTLSQLHLFTDNYEYYNKLYNKHVAYALAVSKAEQLFFQFIKQLGNYLLTKNREELEEVIMIKREMSNICELYESHRLFVLFNIVRIYYLCNVPDKKESLKVHELEIEATLNKISETFERFPNDNFYTNVKPLVNALYFEYFQKIGSQVRANHYFEQLDKLIPELCNKPAMAFFVIQFLNCKIEKFIADNNLDALIFINTELEKTVDFNEREAYHLISYKRYLAICKFYQRDYHGAARAINDVRNRLSMKNFIHTDIDNKLFQAFNYCIMGEDGLCSQIIASLKRQISEQPYDYENVNLFIKIMKTALKPCEFRKKLKRINDLIPQFEAANKGAYRVLEQIVIDEHVIRKMTNPIKE